MNTITHPESRWYLFCCVMDLINLRLAIRESKLNEKAVPNLVETFEVMFSDMLAGDPHSKIGSILFDAKEAEIFEQFQAMDVDFEALGGSWDVMEPYLRSTEFRKILDMAGACLATLMGTGRGLPGWEWAEPQQ